MDYVIPPLRVRQIMLAQADYEDALREAEAALEWAALTASIAGSPDRTALSVMRRNVADIVEAAQ